MPMHAKDFPFEVGDLVLVAHNYITGPERELGHISKINDGSEINEVEVEFNDGTVGEYDPEDIMEGPK